jgi:hypothetical protein
MIPQRLNPFYSDYTPYIRFSTAPALAYDWMRLNDLHTAQRMNYSKNYFYFRVFFSKFVLISRSVIVFANKYVQSHRIIMHFIYHSRKTEEKPCKIASTLFFFFLLHCKFFNSAVLLPVYDFLPHRIYFCTNEKVPVVIHSSTIPRFS